MKWILSKPEPAEDGKRLSIKYKGNPDALIFLNGNWCWFDQHGSSDFIVKDDSWSDIEWLDASPGDQDGLAKQLEEKEKEIVELNEFIKGTRLYDAEKEIVRLKGLIEKMYWKMFQHHLSVPDQFQQFKTDNNL